MNITANNITEVLLALIALAGEIPKTVKISEISERTLQNQISIAKKNKLLKIDSKHERIRLKAPHGLEALQNYSEELFLHYNMVTNNHQFQTGEKALLAQRQFSKTVIKMIKNGYEIDNLSIRHKSNHFGKNEDEIDEIDFVLGNGLLDIGMDKFAADGKIIPLIESTSLIPYEEKRFYTSKYLKLGESINDRINVSRITGIMLSAGNLYSVYYLKDGSRIFKSSEADMNNTIRKVYASAYGKPLRDIEAIIITKEIPARTDRLESIFSHFYFIQDDVYGDFVIQILSCENWREKVQEALYGEPSRDPRVDGIIDNTPSWELVTGEYSKIQKVKKLAGQNPTNFIIFDWQEEGVRRMTKGMNCELQVLTKEQELILLNEVRNHDRHTHTYNI